MRIKRGVKTIRDQPLVVECLERDRTRRSEPRVSADVDLDRMAARRIIGHGQGRLKSLSPVTL
jgi:hypothetical protein